MKSTISRNLQSRAERKDNLGLQVFLALTLQCWVLGTRLFSPLLQEWSALLKELKRDMDPSMGNQKQLYFQLKYLQGLEEKQTKKESCISNKILFHHCCHSRVWNSILKGFAFLWLKCNEDLIASCWFYEKIRFRCNKLFGYCQNFLLFQIFPFEKIFTHAL